MEVQFPVAFELRVDTLEELAVRVQARHFVLVLVGHQLEVIARHRLGQPRGAGGGLLGRGHLVDQILVAPRIGFVLILRQERAADPRQRAQLAGRTLEVHHGALPALDFDDAFVARRRLALADQRLHLRQVVGGAPPQANAARLFSTCWPLSSMARCIAASPSGSQPFW